MPPPQTCPQSCGQGRRWRWSVRGERGEPGECAAPAAWPSPSPPTGRAAGTGLPAPVLPTPGHARLHVRTAAGSAAGLTCQHRWSLSRPWRSEQCAAQVPCTQWSRPAAQHPAAGEPAASCHMGRSVEGWKRLGAAKQAGWPLRQDCRGSPRAGQPPAAGSARAGHPPTLSSQPLRRPSPPTLASRSTNWPAGSCLERKKHGCVGLQMCHACPTAWHVLKQVPGRSAAGTHTARHHTDLRRPRTDTAPAPHPEGPP